MVIVDPYKILKDIRLVYYGIYDIVYMNLAK